MFAVSSLEWTAEEIRKLQKWADDERYSLGNIFSDGVYNRSPAGRTGWAGLEINVDLYVDFEEMLLNVQIYILAFLLLFFIRAKRKKGELW